jgi:RNA polymerase sigma-70 factor (ECF subfamily)
MGEQESFDDLIRRVRAGDQDAAAELVQLYEPAIRRAVRLRLADNRLGRLFDSLDICQSVLGSFFVRAASGQYQLGTPDDLLKLLVTMARTKLAFEARKQQAQQRDYRRVAAGYRTENLVAPASCPKQRVAAQELLDEVHRRLSPDELRLVELRNQDLDWATIAEQVGGSPDGLRMKLTRALDRVSLELGLDE